VDLDAAATSMTRASTPPPPRVLHDAANTREGREREIKA
jgi:hypothetical protein